MSIPTKNGLLRLPRDIRDFNYTQVFGAVSLPTEDFMVGQPLDIKDQGTSDLCTAYALCSVSELQEKVLLSPEWQFAKIKQMIGSYDGFGADFRTVCKSALSYGSLGQDKAEYVLADKGRNFVSNWLNWDKTIYGNGFELEMHARKHRKASYFKVDTRGYQDLFDALRATISRERTGCLTGCIWHTAWNGLKDGIIKLDNEKGQFGHAFALLGQKTIDGTLHLVAQMSNGTEMGDNGYMYFSRGVVNKEFKYGNFIFKDIEPEKVKVSQWTVYQKFVDKLRKMFIDLKKVV